MNSIDKKLLNYLTYLKNHLNKEVLDANKECYVIGVSTGIDSVLALRILLDVLPSEMVNAYFIDIESNEDKKYLKVVQEYFFNNFNFKINEVNLLNSYNALIQDFDIKNEVNNGNIKSKLRSMYLYSQALVNNGLVLNTTNYDEYILGYYTKFGDSNGDVFLLNGLLKKHIKELSKYYNIPLEVINRQPTSGLSLKTDEEEFNFSYEELDNVLLNNSHNQELINKIKTRILKNKHKQKILKNSLLKPFKKYKF